MIIFPGSQGLARPQYLIIKYHLYKHMIWINIMYRYILYNKYITYIDILPPLLVSLSLVWSWGSETPKKLPKKESSAINSINYPGNSTVTPLENRLKLLVIQEEVQHIPHSSVNTSREILKKGFGERWKKQDAAKVCP